jgi:hypothetical protein
LATNVVEYAEPTVPSGIVPPTNTGAEFPTPIVSTNICVALGSEPFDAVTVKVYVPAAVGVPVSKPDAVRETPGGKSAAVVE